jgi:hypothetical protein
MKWSIKHWLWFMSLAALVACSSCATPGPRPVEYREVKVAVPVRCAPKLGPEPDYPDTDAKLKAAQDDFDWVKRLVAGRLMRIARDAEKSAALAACAGSPAP